MPYALDDVDEFTRVMVQMGVDPGSRRTFGEGAELSTGAIEFDNAVVIRRQGEIKGLVFGPIFEHWRSLGGADSYLGIPVGPIRSLSDGGASLEMRDGWIFWWPDTGAVDIHRLTITYRGLNCFGETGDEQLSGRDEPYVVITVATKTGSETIRSQIYTEVDAGDTRPDDVLFWSGPPDDFVLNTVLFEHDFTDADKILDAIRKLNRDGGIAKLLELIAWFGPIGKLVSLASSVALQSLVPIVKAMNLQDDLVGATDLLIPVKAAVLQAIDPRRQHERNITFTQSTPLISGLGASYKVYFEIAATPPPF